MLIKAFRGLFQSGRVVQQSQFRHRSRFRDWCRFRDCLHAQSCRSESLNFRASVTDTSRVQFYIGGMNTEHAPLILDGADVESFDHLERWQTIGIAALSITGLALVVTGVGSMVLAVSHALGRLLG